MVKLDVDTLSTVPDAPPAAVPDRALDPPPDPVLPATPPPGTGRSAVGDVATATESPTTAAISAAAHLLVTRLHALAVCSALAADFSANTASVHV